MQCLRAAELGHACKRLTAASERAGRSELQWAISQSGSDSVFYSFFILFFRAHPFVTYTSALEALGIVIDLTPCGDLIAACQRGPKVTRLSHDFPRLPAHGCYTQRSR
jgi:hypothetical protein